MPFVTEVAGEVAPPSSAHPAGAINLAPTDAASLRSPGMAITIPVVALVALVALVSLVSLASLVFHKEISRHHLEDRHAIDNQRSKWLF